MHKSIVTLGTVLSFAITLSGCFSKPAEQSNSGGDSAPAPPKSEVKEPSWSQAQFSLAKGSNGLLTITLNAPKSIGSPGDVLVVSRVLKRTKDSSETDLHEEPVVRDGTPQVVSIVDDSNTLSRACDLIEKSIWVKVMREDFTVFSKSLSSTAYEDICDKLALERILTALENVAFDVPTSFEANIENHLTIGVPDELPSDAKLKLYADGEVIGEALVVAGKTRVSFSVPDRGHSYDFKTEIAAVIQTSKASKKYDLGVSIVTLRPALEQLQELLARAVQIQGPGETWACKRKKCAIPIKVSIPESKENHALIQYIEKYTAAEKVASSLRLKIQAVDDAQDAAPETYSLSGVTEKALGFGVALKLKNEKEKVRLRVELWNDQDRIFESEEIELVVYLDPSKRIREPKHLMRQR